MSYEGYVQFICKNGHYNKQPEAHDGDQAPCHCGTGYVWENRVNDTNCDAFGVIPDHVMRMFIVTDEILEECNLGHKHVMSEATYTAPSPAQTQSAQHCYKNGKLIPVNPKNFKALMKGLRR